MKKRNTRSTLFVLLICASISSAVYLSLIAPDISESDLPTIELQEEITNTKERPLPDVDLLKKVLKVSERAMRLLE